MPLSLNSYRPGQEPNNGQLPPTAHAFTTSGFKQGTQNKYQSVPAFNDFRFEQAANSVSLRQPGQIYHAPE